MANSKPYIVLDSGETDEEQIVQTIKQDVQQNRVEFVFPEGFAVIPLIEECRALDALDDFDLMYDITMQLLVEKPVIINLKGYKPGERQELARFVVTNRYMDLRGVPIINQYPILVLWLTKLVARHLAKKFPRPSIVVESPKTTSKKAQGTD